MAIQIKRVDPLGGPSRGSPKSKPVVAGGGPKNNTPPPVEVLGGVRTCPHCGEVLRALTSTERSRKHRSIDNV